MDQEIILTFKTDYLRNAFHNTIASNASDGSGQTNWKSSGKDLPF